MRLPEDPLPAGQWDAVFGFAEDCLSVRDYGAVRSRLLSGLRTSVGCDAATLTHLDLASSHEVVVVDAARRIDPSQLREYPRDAGRHPLRRLLLTANSAPPRISEVLTRQEWASHPLRAHSHREISDQMTMPLARRGSVVQAITLSRSRGVFGPRQQQVLHRLRTHLRFALAHCPVEGAEGWQLEPIPARVPLISAPGLAPLRRLSPREREVLHLVAQGRTDAQIARTLGLRPATVSKHLHRVYSRHGLTNRAAAVELLRAGGGETFTHSADGSG